MFLHYVETLVPLLIHAFCFETPDQRVKVVNFDVCKKGPKINCLPYQRPFGYCKTHVSFIIHITRYAVA